MANIRDSWRNSKIIEKIKTMKNQATLFHSLHYTCVLNEKTVLFQKEKNATNF